MGSVSERTLQVSRTAALRYQPSLGPSSAPATRPACLETCTFGWGNRPPCRECCDGWERSIRCTTREISSSERVLDTEGSPRAGGSPGLRLRTDLPDCLYRCCARSPITQLGDSESRRDTDSLSDKIRRRTFPSVRRGRSSFLLTIRWWANLPGGSSCAQHKRDGRNCSLAYIRCTPPCTPRRQNTSISRSVRGQAGPSISRAFSGRLESVAWTGVFRSA